MIKLSNFSVFKGRRLHMGICGSVAAYKSIELMRELQKAGIAVSVTLTESAMQFLTPLTFEALGADPVYTKMFGQDEGILFAHLQPGRTAEAVLICPATASTIARLASGLADEMLAAQVLAFPGPVVIAPAMNPHMWQHPATRHNVSVLRERGCIFVQPVTGQVACGDTGQGKLADVGDISLITVKSLLTQDLNGKTVLITLGPTREAWDGVRVWTNLSTGKMGAALAYAAYLRGAKVHAVAGPGVPSLPSGVERHDVSSACHMFSVAKDIWPLADFGIFTAAVADFYPKPHGPEKFKKHQATGGFSLEFLPNPDILATLAAESAPHQTIVGFAAETENLEASVRSKLQRKKAHMVVGNLIGKPDSGFGTSSNTVYVCDVNGREEQWPPLSKEDVAWRLLDWLLTL